jgi:hypothetical protein
MKTYNIFYCANDSKDFQRNLGSVDAIDFHNTDEYKSLSLLQKNGAICSFGWTTIIPYSQG